MNRVFHEEAKELYQRCRQMMQGCVVHATGGKSACEVCEATGPPPCACREMAIFIEALYVAHGGDPLLLTAKVNKDGTTRIKID